MTTGTDAEREIRVLYVDDNPQFAGLVKRRLRQVSDCLSVDSVRSADEGLEVLADRSIDCVVSDYEMPRMDGLGFLAAVRDVDPELPFILFTQRPPEQIADEAISAGATEYLQKGGTLSRYVLLANRVRNAVERYRLRQGDSKSEQELQFYNELIEEVGVGVGVYTADGRFTHVNQAYADLLGRDVDSVVGTAVWEINPAVEPEAFDGYWRSFEDGETRVFETIHRRSDGTTISVEVVTTCRELRGTRYHFGTVREITERKERERELRRQNERLDEFAELVSHDLRNPLNVAQSYVEEIREVCDHEHLDAVSEAHERIDQIVDETLTLARLGDAIGDREAVDLVELVRTCWRTVDTGDATLELDRPPTVRADADRLQHLFENLFRNAVEHGSTSPRSTPSREDDIDQGTGVTVRVGELEGGFYVGDDGRGFSDGATDEVFDRGHSTSDGGTGFGLAIVEGIVDAHGWDIGVTESDAGGARFEIRGSEVVSVDDSVGMRP
jgi:PAS domain S-box-containing protein